MTAVPSPALQRFLAALRETLCFAQVWIRRRGARFELRHVEDREAADGGLRTVAVSGLRDLAQFTADGAFRPLRAAPNMQAGWRAEAADDLELETALNQLYPGALADWHAAQQIPVPVTDYRPFTARQTGMYRITTLLSDEQVAEMTRACCDQRFCLKQRRWTVAGLEPDAPAEKSLIPCLEPCAVLLEFARKVARIEQEEKVATELSPSDLETVVAALDRFAAPKPGAAPREADFNEPANPRRIQRVVERLRKLVPGPAARSGGKPD